MNKLIFHFVIMFLTSSMLFAYSGGSGIMDDPYRIENITDFHEFTSNPNDWNKYFILTADIDLSEHIYSQSCIAPDTDIITSGFQGIAFTGTFEGDNYSLSNLYLDLPNIDYLGLFGAIGSCGQIRNLKLVNFKINGRNCIGGVCGWNQGGTIIRSNISGLITGDSYVGGIAGVNWSNISSCCAMVSVNASTHIGGITGYNHGTIRNSYTMGNIFGSSNSFYVGGIGGLNHGNVLTCFSFSSVQGFGDVGGLVGNNDSFGGYYNPSIQSCYASGPVNGSSQVGGLVGFNSNGSIINCYSIGTVSGISNLGGLCGLNSGVITNSFWDIGESGCLLSDGGKGQTTIQMKTLSTFTTAGWDFINIWAIGLQNQTYPFLRQDTTGDLNYDNIVDLNDLSILAVNWLD